MEKPKPPSPRGDVLIRALPRHVLDAIEHVAAANGFKKVEAIRWMLATHPAVIAHIAASRGDDDRD